MSPPAAEPGLDTLQKIGGVLGDVHPEPSSAGEGEIGSPLCAGLAEANGRLVNHVVDPTSGDDVCTMYSYEQSSGSERLLYFSRARGTWSESGFEKLAKSATRESRAVSWQEMRLDGREVAFLSSRDGLGEVLWYLGDGYGLLMEVAGSDSFAVDQAREDALRAAVACACV